MKIKNESDADEQTEDADCKAKHNWPTHFKNWLICLKRKKEDNVGYKERQRKKKGSEKPAAHALCIIKQLHILHYVSHRYTARKSNRRRWKQI